MHQFRSSTSLHSWLGKEIKKDNRLSGLKKSLSIFDVFLMYHVITNFLHLKDQQQTSMSSCSSDMSLFCSSVFVHVLSTSISFDVYLKTSNTLVFSLWLNTISKGFHILNSQNIYQMRGQQKIITCDTCFPQSIFF